MKIRVTFVLKALVGVLFLAVVGIIAANLLTHGKKQADIPLVGQVMDEKNAVNQEKIEHIDSEGLKENYYAKADKHYKGDDDRYYAEGNVAITFPKRREGKDVVVYGDQIVYDKDGVHFSLRGNGKVIFDEFTVESPSLDYNNKKEVFETDQNVRFFSERLAGSGDRMTYLMKEDKILLEDNTHVRVLPKVDATLPLDIYGDEFEYSRISKRGFMTGNVQVLRGESRAMAQHLEFELFLESDEVRTLILRGESKAWLVDPEAEQPMRTIQADTIRIRAFLNTPIVHAVEAEGSCTFFTGFPDGENTQIQADSIEFVMDRVGELRELHALSAVRMTEKGKPESEPQTITGESLFMEGKQRYLEVKGDTTTRARVLSHKREIMANEIRIDLDSMDMLAQGEIKVIFNMLGDEDKTIGFFIKQQPVFISAARMRYFPGDKRFQYEGSVKVWQEKVMMFAKQLSMDRLSGAITCSGGVKTIIPYTPKDQEEQRVEISAGQLMFDAEERQIAYDKNGSLKVKNISLKAKSIKVQLAEEKQDLERIFARGSVVIIQDQNEGRGKEAIYDISEDKIVLTGKPIFIDKNKGQTEGDKLTFHLSDGKIVIENRGRERSVTVIK